MCLAIDLITNEKEGKTILCEHCENYYQGFNKYMKNEINTLVYMGKWQALVGVELKFCL